MKGISLWQPYVSGVLGIRDSGKALALDTPLPTPTGWTTMGEIRVGDRLFDESGRICQVLYATDVQHDRQCFRVAFSDGSSVVADADHLWLTETYASRTADRNAKAKGSPRAGMGREGRPQCERRSFPGLVTTAEIAATIVAGGGEYRENNHAINNAGALDLPERQMPISPYVLGCWLGDGTGQCATVTTADDELLQNIREEGYHIGKAFNPSVSGLSATYRVQQGPDGVTLNQRLREAGLLQNKHVPEIYLRASEKQRRALLAGLMDTDGSVQRGSNSCIFYNTNRTLAEAAYDLVCSMGWSATFTTKRARLNGVDHGECYAVRFRPTDNIFRLSRKASMLDFSVAHAGRRGRRMIVAVDPVPSVPVRCIRVSSESHLFLCGRAMVPTHNTYTATLLAEKLFESGVPFTAFDPIGVWRFLRVPGKGRGYPVVVAGGQAGDLPLTPASAPAIGAIRLHMHRPLPSKPVACKVKREGRNWYALLTVEVPCAAVHTGPAVGIDLGIASLAALSTGETIRNPRAYARAQRRLRRHERALARCCRGSSGRRKARERVAAAHAKVRRARDTHLHQVAASLTQRYGLIAIEALNVKGLARSMLAREVNDAAWARLISMLRYKAARAGAVLVEVDPRFTSQTCPDCGTVKAKTLAERTHRCECGCVLDRDVAAARVILHRAVVGPSQRNVAGCGERAGGKLVRPPRTETLLQGSEHQMHSRRIPNVEPLG